jgi:hypothetical protein
MLARRDGAAGALRRRAPCPRRAGASAPRQWRRHGDRGRRRRAGGAPLLPAPTGSPRAMRALSARRRWNSASRRRRAGRSRSSGPPRRRGQGPDGRTNRRSCDGLADRATRPAGRAPPSSGTAASTPTCRRAAYRLTAPLCRRGKRQRGDRARERTDEEAALQLTLIPSEARCALTVSLSHPS